MKRKKILVIMGTRPEVIKLAPVYQAIKQENNLFETKLLVTAQHREMLDQPLANFQIQPDYDLDIMRHQQDLFDVTINGLRGLKAALTEYQPDCLLVQGDTTTTFIGGLAAFYLKIPVGHVEAGLRTYNKFSPYPEEVNRRLTSCLADFHFAPTLQSKQNLIKENISEQSIWITGNTTIDALLWTIQQTTPQLSELLPTATYEALFSKFILLTTHRRESFGEPLKRTLTAVDEIASKFQDVHIIFPVHRNPNVRQAIDEVLQKRSNIHLIEPLDYTNFAHLMSMATIILTDSGGVQEEGPSLNKPILVLRDITERPEGVTAGVAKLLGTNKDKIVQEVSRLLTDEGYYKTMTGKQNPYGDGDASKRIVKVLKENL